MMAPIGEVLARIAWSRIAEPGDIHAGETISLLGAVDALEWLRHNAGGGSALGPSARASVARWAPRLAALNPAADLDVFERLGGKVVIPDDPDWPVQLDDLGNAAPFVLWVRGKLALPGSARARAAQAVGGVGAANAVGKEHGNLAPGDLAAGNPELGNLAAGNPAPGNLGIAVVGSRSSTRYGESVAAELGYGLAAAGRVVISGGAYGIDAAVHRGALAQGERDRTLAVLAGGADRMYPAGNAGLLDQVIAHGAVISELAPGAAPTRHRFLARNRLIAALGGALVVVEAANRSGAQSTANHAAALLRPIGAVPGPVTSVASTGCHKLLREGTAVCVTGVEDVLELASPMGSGLAAGEPTGQPGLLDDLDPMASRVLDVMPTRNGCEVDSLVRSSGLAPMEVMVALGSLEVAGRVRRSGSRWARVAS